MRYFTVYRESVERTHLFILYAMLDNSIHSVSSICNKYCVLYYKTGVNRVAHFAELVNMYRSTIKIIVLSSCLKKTAQCYDRCTKTERDFYYDRYCTSRF